MTPDPEPPAPVRADTPRTDAFIKCGPENLFDYIEMIADFARQLERELSAAKAPRADTQELVERLRDPGLAFAQPSRIRAALNAAISALTAQQGLPEVVAERDEATTRYKAAEQNHAWAQLTVEILRSKLAESEKEVELWKASSRDFEADAKAVRQQVADMEADLREREALDAPRDSTISDLREKVRATEQERDAAVADAKRLAEALGLLLAKAEGRVTDEAGKTEQEAHHALAATPFVPAKHGLSIAEAASGKSFGPATPNKGEK